MSVRKLTLSNQPNSSKREASRLFSQSKLYPKETWLTLLNESKYIWPKGNRTIPWSELVLLPNCHCLMYTSGPNEAREQQMWAQAQCKAPRLRIKTLEGTRTSRKWESTLHVKVFRKVKFGYSRSSTILIYVQSQHK